MIDINRDGDYGTEYEYYLNNDSCGVVEFYRSLNKDILIVFENSKLCNFEEYEAETLASIDSGFETILNGNIYDKSYVYIDDDEYDDRYECGCCRCCGCTCYEDDEEDRWEK